jgi:hypothetical protein
VLVLAASAHRAPALEASQFLIDWLKTRPVLEAGTHERRIGALGRGARGGRRSREAVAVTDHARLIAKPVTLASPLC